MKIGLKLNTQFLPEQSAAQSVRELVEQVELAAAVGFSSVWVSQHYLATPYQAVQTWPMLGLVAAHSGDMQVGSSIFLLPLHNPVYAVEQATTLDVITGGRFVFGIGLGYRPEEFEAFGVELSTRADRFTESLEVARRLWTEAEVTHHGRFFDLTAARLTLRPVQQPHPPIWVAASGDRAVRRAGRLGLPWLVNPHASLTGIERQMGLYLDELADAGHQMPADRPVFKEFAIAETHRDAVRRARPHLEGKYASYAKWGLDKPMPEEERLDQEFDELARERFIIGTPEECVVDLREHEARVHANHFLLRMQWPGMPHEEVLSSIEMVGREVIPRVTESGS